MQTLKRSDWVTTHHEPAFTTGDEWVVGGALPRAMGAGFVADA